MVVTSKCAKDAKRFKSNIKRFWEVTDHGPIKWFLGFEIQRNQGTKTIAINQRAYIKSLVEKFRMSGAKLGTTPMQPGTQFFWINVRHP